MKHRIFILLITLLSSLSISAQKFVLDPLFGDSVKVSFTKSVSTFLDGIVATADDGHFEFEWILHKRNFS